MSGMWWLERRHPRLLVLSAALIAALLVGCSQLGGNRSLGSPENPIKMAIVPFVESGRLVRGMQLLSDELKKETGLTYTGDVPTSYAAVVEAMCADRVDIGWVSPLAYILASDKCGADMSLVSVTRVGTQYWGTIVTRTDSPIEKIEDLRGKRFAWVDPGSTSGYLFPRVILGEHKLTPEDLGQQVFAGGHDKVGLAVLQGQVDAGAMGKDSIPRLNSIYPNAERELRIVEESPPIPNDGVAFRKGLSPEIVQKTREALLRISAREDGQKLFEDAIGTRGVAETTDAAYEPVRRAATVLNMDLQTELSKPK
jgi:phosphonate transport system substrate-binding protein